MGVGVLVHQKGGGAMTTNTNIQWTDHTFNPWWGCTKVHAGCKNCYAEATDKRWGGNHWGNGPRRMILGEWAKPLKWAQAAEEAGKIARVFCASMCDIFEDYDGPVVNQQGKPIACPTGGNWTVPLLRVRALSLIELTHGRLEWQLLTKRPENVTRMVPRWWMERWPTNVMVGTSPCDQKTADACIPNLLRVPGRHFLSCEPLVGPLDLSEFLGIGGDVSKKGAGVTKRELCRVGGITGMEFDAIADAAGVPVSENERGNLGWVDWVIVGGESGRDARPCDVAWIRSIVAQCKAAGVQCFVKQLGSHPVGFAQWMHPDNEGHGIEMGGGRRLADPKGGDPDEWADDLRVRELPPTHKAVSR